MRAVFYTGGQIPWVSTLGKERLWPLLPMGNRPLLEYWIDLCVALGIREIHFILGEGAVRIEQFAESGSRWGVDINYGFIREGESPLSYLRKRESKWADGLLFCSGPFFQLRNDRFDLEAFTADIEAGSSISCQMESCRLLISKDASVVSKFIAGEPLDNEGSDGFSFLHSLHDFYKLNMDLIAGASRRYVTPGYFSKDGNYIGYNVVIPSAVQLKGPLNIASNCRFSPLCTIGPNVVIGDHVIVDRNTEIADSIILGYTYLGCNLEIKNKIISGARIIDPEDGTCLDLTDPWLVSSSRGSDWWNQLQRPLGKLCALVLLILIGLPFALLYFVLVFTKSARFEARARLLADGVEKELPRLVVLKQNLIIRLFLAFSLDRTPLLQQVMRGKLHLCGQPVLSPDRMPEWDEGYWPGVFSYADSQEELRGVLAAEYYHQLRSVREDIKIFGDAVRARFIHALRGDVFSLTR